MSEREKEKKGGGKGKKKKKKKKKKENCGLFELECWFSTVTHNH